MTFVLLAALFGGFSFLAGWVSCQVIMTAQHKRAVHRMVRQAAILQQLAP